MSTDSFESVFMLQTLEPCPFEFGLKKFALDPVGFFFFKNAKKVTSGGLILFLAKFGLIPSKYYRRLLVLWKGTCAPKAQKPVTLP